MAGGKRVVVACAVVGVLGLLSAVTGFAAEGTRIKPDKVLYYPPSTCKYPGSPSVGLGITSALSLLVAQLFVSISTGCLCCSRGPRPSTSKWTISIIFCVISWIAFIIAFVLLIVGAVVNTKREQDTVRPGENECYAVRPGLFAGATVMGIVCLVLGMVYYVLLNSAKDSSNPAQANIAMGHPQYPPSHAPAYGK